MQAQHSGRFPIDPGAHEDGVAPGLVLDFEAASSRPRRRPRLLDDPRSSLQVVAAMQAARESEVEHIELSGTDTRSRALAESASRPINAVDTTLLVRVTELEQQNRLLVAQLDELRSQVETRDLEHAAAMAARDSEVSRLSDELMSVTLERDGLKSRWSEIERARGGATGPRGAVPPAGALTGGDPVQRLKARLNERAHAISAAREEIDFLNDERRRLIEQVATLAEQIVRSVEPLRGQPSSVGVVVTEQHETDLREAVRRLWRSVSRRSLRGVRQPAKGSGRPSAASAGPPQDPPALPTVERAADERASESASIRAKVVDPLPQAGVEPAERRFLVTSGEGRHATFELKGPLVSVGRGQKADVCVADPSVSRLHAVLRHGEGGTLVEDLASANGVFVNGKAVRMHVLKAGDELAFGNVRFTYQVGASDLAR
jgi:hypothetical protein